MKNYRQTFVLLEKYGGDVTAVNALLKKQNIDTPNLSGGYQ